VPAVVSFAVLLRVGELTLTTVLSMDLGRELPWRELCRPLRRG
jgi:hypothetical protein